jgi:hypothetical protein
MPIWNPVFEMKPSGSVLQTLRMQEEKEDSTAALREFAVPGVIIDTVNKNFMGMFHETLRN